MVDPLVALSIFGAVTLLAALLFWPRRGIIVRLLRLLRMTERVRVEDALKHLHNREYRGRPSFLESMAGALEISQARTVTLVARLEQLGIMRSDGDGLLLTKAGRAYALRVIRSHRLWERYLADRTSVNPVDWHDKAEVREHTLTTADVDELDARMGHPRFDPHGDPIPTADGELPPQSGVALTALAPGKRCSILHLEDEPREIYDRLVAAGLAPGMAVQVVEVTPTRIRFTADGTELAFEPVVATNITVTSPAAARPVEDPAETLLTLKLGESATVARISPACHGAQRRRLLDLGLVPGTELQAELEGALGDPTAYRIRGAVIALRKSQAEWIYIHRSSAGAKLK